MELKKNPKKDLTRNSGMYFATGMFLVLTLTYAALEWKTFFETPDYDTALHVEEQLDEKIDIFKIELPPPPKPLITPPVIEIVPDEEEIIETVIEAVEPDQDYEVADVNDVIFEEVEEDVPVSFIVVEDVPVFPGCENNSDKRACFNKMILNHVRKTFRYPEISQEMGIQGKVYMHFVIQKDGSIGNVQIARSPDKNLGEEATRIIDRLPKMTPGKQRGKAVRVPFSIPITFKLQ